MKNVSYLIVLALALVIATAVNAKPGSNNAVGCVRADTLKMNLPDSNIFAHVRTHNIDASRWVNFPAKPLLYVVDGKAMSQKDFAAKYSARFNTDFVVTVLHPDEGIKKYGDKGKNGVVILKSK